MKEYYPLVSSEDRTLIESMTNIRFKDKDEFRTPETLILYEQGYMSEEQLLAMCKIHYSKKLETPRISNVTKDMLKHFKGSYLLPYRIDTVSRELHVMVVPEKYSENVEPFEDFTVVKHIVPLYHFIREYTVNIGEPTFLCELTAKDCLALIVSEATRIGASDITLVPKEIGAEIYYNVRKKKVYSKRRISKESLDEILKIIMSNSNASFNDIDKDPKYMSLDLDIHHRGRVAMLYSYYGRMSTIRVLENTIFNKTLEILNIDERTRYFIRKYFMSMEPGLRLMVGPTDSGKNTTLASVLIELNANNIYKVMSVEDPIELTLIHIEQIPANGEQSYKDNVFSMIRHNPDIMYLSEFTQRSAEGILEACNTHKPVYSTIHANSIADVVSRIADLTGYSLDRIIRDLNAVIFQVLVRDEEKDALYPETRFMYFTKEIKRSLYGKNYGIVMSMLDDYEEEWKNKKLEDI